MSFPKFHDGTNVLPCSRKTPWPHAPTHCLSCHGTYFVTASTYLKTQHFCGKPRLQVLHRGLLKLALQFGWQMEAWAVFSNHYHFIAHSPATSTDASSLSEMLQMLHAKTAGWVNKLDREPGRKVWFNYRETQPDAPSLDPGSLELRLQ